MGSGVLTTHWGRDLNEFEGHAVETRLKVMLELSSLSLRRRENRKRTLSVVLVI